MWRGKRRAGKPEDEDVRARGEGERGGQGSPEGHQFATKVVERLKTVPRGMEPVGLDRPRNRQG